MIVRTDRASELDGVANQDGDKTQRSSNVRDGLSENVLTFFDFLNRVLHLHFSLHGKYEQDSIWSVGKNNFWMLK